MGLWARSLSASTVRAVAFLHRSVVVWAKARRASASICDAMRVRRAHHHAATPLGGHGAFSKGSIVEGGRNAPLPILHFIMRTDLFDFDLPAERIALRPASPRDSARLLVVRPGQAPEYEDRGIADLPDLLRPGDALVFNDTKVIAARLSGRRIGRGE